MAQVKVRCGRCGAAVSAGNFCEQCGASLQQADGRRAAATDSQRPWEHGPRPPQGPAGWVDFEPPKTFRLSPYEVLVIVLAGVLAFGTLAITLTDSGDVNCRTLYPTIAYQRCLRTQASDLVTFAQGAAGIAAAILVLAVGGLLRRRWRVGDLFRGSWGVEWIMIASLVAAVVIFIFCVAMGTSQSAEVFDPLPPLSRQAWWTGFVRGVASGLVAGVVIWFAFVLGGRLRAAEARRHQRNADAGSRAVSVGRAQPSHP